MSEVANCPATEQVAIGGDVTGYRKGAFVEVLPEGIAKAEKEYYSKALRIGRKRNDGPVAAPQPEPFYRQFRKNKYD